MVRNVANARRCVPHGNLYRTPIFDRNRWAWRASANPLLAKMISLPHDLLFSPCLDGTVSLRQQCLDTSHMMPATACLAKCYRLMHSARWHAYHNAQTTACSRLAPRVKRQQAATWLGQLLGPERMAVAVSSAQVARPVSRPAHQGPRPGWWGQWIASPPKKEDPILQEEVNRPATQSSYRRQVGSS